MTRVYPRIPLRFIQTTLASLLPITVGLRLRKSANLQYVLFSPTYQAIAWHRIHLSFVNYNDSTIFDTDLPAAASHIFFKSCGFLPIAFVEYSGIPGDKGNTLSEFAQII